MKVLDASAVLVFLQGEPGADLVETAPATGAIAGAANWSEVAQKVIASGGDWDLAEDPTEDRHQCAVSPVSDVLGSHGWQHV